MFDYITYINENDSEYLQKYDIKKREELYTLSSQSKHLEKNIHDNYNNFTMIAISSLIVTIVGTTIFTSSK